MSGERGRLYNAAAMAHGSGDYRKSADLYRKSYEAHKQNGKTFQQLDYCSFHAYTSLLRYEEVPNPSDDDFVFLRAVGSNANASAIVRTMAFFTSGFLRRNKGDREGAARHYRKAIQAADAATPAERARQELMPGAAALEQKNVGVLLDKLRSEAATNLGVLEGNVPNSACGADVKIHGLSVPIGMSCSSEDREGARQLLEQLSVSGSACDHCGRKPAPSDPRLLMCSGCRSAWYCDKACQTAARPAHKSECGPLKPGQRAMLKGLESQPLLNGTVVVLLSFIEESQRWEVSIIGGDKKLRVKEQNLQRLREPR